MKRFYLLPGARDVRMHSTDVLFRFADKSQFKYSHWFSYILDKSAIARE